MQSMVSYYWFDLLIYGVPLILLFLLVVAVALVWLNLRDLRIHAHVDLKAIRESLDRLAGVVPEDAQGGSEAAAPAPEENPAEPAAPESIWFSCPECGKLFEGASALSGTTYKCPECQVDFRIH